MPILTYQLGPMANNTYLVIDEATNDAAIVDPSFDSEKILDDIRAQNLNLRYILLTHAHFDHVVGNAFFVQHTGAAIALHLADVELLRESVAQAQRFQMAIFPSPEPTIFLEDNMIVQLGETPIQVLFTPGHAQGHVAFLIGDTVLSGDALFQGSIGRTDLQNGSLPTLLNSIATKLLTLPDDTRVLPGHGAPTNIGRERRTNPHLRNIASTP